MTVEVRVAYQGDLRCELLHGPSGAQLVTDAPVDNEGRGESFSPTDLVAAALGSCMLTIMGLVARRRGIPLEGATARVAKEMVADPERRIGRLAVTITVPAPLAAAERQFLERAALACPVHHSLHPRVEVPVRFEWAGAPAAAS